MKKWLIWTGSILLAILATCSPISAQESSELGLTFEGESAEFITYETGSAYEDIMPGEERIQTVTLTNNDYRELKFYVRADYVAPLGEGKANEQIAYDVRFSNKEETFFDGKIGGVTKANMKNLDTNYLLKTLKKGESTTMDLMIKVDGDSMDNSYQGTVGNLNLIFSVEHDTETPMEKITTTVKKIPVINKIPGISTGDTTAVGMLLGVFAVCLIVIVAWIVLKIKKGKDEQHEKM